MSQTGLSQEVQETIALYTIMGFTSMNLFSPAQTREAMKHMPIPALTSVGEVINIRVTDDQIPIRLYIPNQDGPFSIVAYYHGGGFSIMSIDTHDEICRQLCKGSNSIVMSVDYRLAPEYPYPTGPKDCVKATNWIIQNAATYNGNCDQVAVAGDSAGGYMALYVAQKLTQAGIKLKAQFAAYPVTDHYSAEHASYQENSDGYTLSAELMRWFWDNFLIDESNYEEASPLRATDFSGLPAALIMTCNYDPIRDEGKAYADKLQRAGVATVYQNYENVHGFLATGQMGEEAMQTACQFLRTNFKN